MPVSNALTRFLKLSLVAIFAMMLSACNSLQLAYNFAPGLIAYRMNSYLNLDEKQQATLDQELVSFTAWHDETALPLYTKTLNQWATRVENGQPFDASEILGLQETVEQQLRALGLRAGAQLGPLMASLGPRQTQRLKVKLDESNQEYFSDYLKNTDSPRNIKKRHQRVIERFEDWLGTLTVAQQKILTQTSDARTPMLARWDAERKLRQKDLLSMMRAQENADSKQAQQALQVYLGSLNQYRDPTLIAQRDALRLEWAQATADILNSATPAQKIFLQKKLRGYAQDFAALTPKHVAQASEKN